MFTFVLLFGCGAEELDLPCGVQFRDADGDGFGDAEESRIACGETDGWADVARDCDDGDADTFPGAREQCDGEDHDCDGRQSRNEVWYPDADGDGYGDHDDWRSACYPPEGYVDDAGDCDDTRGTVHPGADERCDLVDEDCDGAIDEDPAALAPTWYADADGDGYGDPAVAMATCYRPPAHVADATDCDDADADVFPGAPEPDCDDPVDRNCDGSLGYSDLDGDGSVACLDCDDGDATRGPTMPETCDGEDDDCDGDIDEDDAEDADAWYTDEDSDGYGTGDATYACEGGPRLASRAGDCDDGDASVNPTAAETCATAQDEDCDGDADEADAVGCVSWYPDEDGDGWGADEVCTCEITGPTATGDGDCDDADPGALPGGVEVCGSGVDEDCLGSPACGVADALAAGDAAVTIVGGTGSSYLGWSLAVMDDLDGDGVGELVVGALGLVGATGSAGGFLVFGATASGSPAESDARARLYAEDNGGRVVAGLGDTDGDGVGDLALADPWLGTDEGRLYVVGGADLSGELALADQPMRVGLAADDELGASVAGPGDVDGDGLADVLVGAAGVGDEGAAYLFAGPVTGTDDATDAVATLEGMEYGDAAGYEVTGGDLDGDGLADVVVTAWGGGDGGHVVLLHGPLLGTVPLSEADAVVRGVEADNGIGYSLALGDMDGDGTPDLAMGAPHADGPSYRSGRVHIVAGPFAGDVSTTDATATVGAESPYQYAGFHVAFTDLDADGRADLVAASQFSSAVYDYGLRVFAGPLAGALDSDAQVATVGGDTGTYLGMGAAGAGDVDGDGFGDLWTSAPYADEGGTDAGAAYLFCGGVGP